MNEWFKAVEVTKVPENCSVTIRYKSRQIALFNFTLKDEWYASQNLCPHKRQMTLGRGLIGDKEGLPKVTCPMHKKSFCLKDGKNLNDEDLSIITYETKVKEGFVFINLPVEEHLIPK